jgi:hypothetical protein
MGTGYKGGSQSYRSIGQNLLITSSKYSFKNGYFGENSIHGSKDRRNIKSDENINTAHDFYNKIAFGGKENIVNSNMRITRMHDGTVITMRIKSHSDGTPVVDINIKNSTYAGGIKSQKIHFTQEDKNDND